MGEGTRQFRVGTPADSLPAIREAAAILASGGLVAFPTETVYGIGANADDEAAMDRLCRVKQRPPGKPFTVHIADLKDVDRHVKDVSVVALKLMDEFWPGPLTLVIEQPTGTIGLRLPAHEVARSLIRESGVPVVAPSANVSGEEPAVSGEQVLARFDGQIDAVVFGGESALRQSSTVVRVGRTDWELLREGIISESMIKRTIKTHIVFVCTGNTCRSPIAEALCREALAEHHGVEEADLPALGYVVSSAGTATAGGSRLSSGALEAASRAGLDIADHRSQPVTRALLKDADHVFVMTAMHLADVRSTCPEAAHKAELLDPAGDEVPDPIGLPADQFETVIAQIRRSIEKRVGDL